ncbi:hypothetical protein A0H81_08640 [Grifola frondosa]|uniref:Uncharacterized protein n=1 Tax=Grifola frondosa TaxID=5627 RepID=A0A1C7M556_GRIFR|nr:hypothetical protein A0H81_08640 [Grifola frondosa]
MGSDTSPGGGNRRTRKLNVGNLTPFIQHRRATVELCLPPAKHPGFLDAITPAERRSLAPQLGRGANTLTCCAAAICRNAAADVG